MKVAVVGLGKLGAPMALLFAEAGLEVMGVDTNPDLLDGLKRGVTSNPEPHLAEMLAEHGGKIDWRSEVADAAVCDVVFVVVPTPSLDSGAFDCSAVVQVASTLASACPEGAQVAFCCVSTVNPGDCEGPIAEALSAAPSMGLAFSPEFIALGDVFAGMRRPDLILVGERESWAGHRALTCLRSIRHGFPDNLHPGQRYVKNAPAICRMGLTEAEITKLAINSYVTMKISWANTLGAVARGLGADPHTVARAVGADSRIGHAYLRPGGGYGGPCFPRDQRAFAHVARTVGVASPLSTAVDQVNRASALDWADRVMALHPSKVAVLGTAYKPATDVTEQSFGLAVADAINDCGITVVTWDPLAVCDEPDLDRAIADADVVVVATSDRPEFIHPNVVDCWR